MLKKWTFTLNFYIFCLKKKCRTGFWGETLQFMGSESKTSVMKLCCAAVGHCIGFPLGKLISIINGKENNNGYISGHT